MLSESAANTAFPERLPATDARGRQQEALLVFGRHYEMPPDACTMARDVLAILIDACPADIGLFAERGNKNMRVAVDVRGPAMGAGSLENVLVAPHSLLATTAASGHVTVIADISQNQLFQQSSLQQLGIASAVAVPLQHFRRSQGTLLLGSIHARHFSPDDIAFVEAMSHLMAAGMAVLKVERDLISVTAAAAGKRTAPVGAAASPPQADRPQPAARAPESTGSEPAGKTRRMSERKMFPFELRVAPYHGRPPRESDFCLTRFNDVSAGGGSFFLTAQPNYREVVIELHFRETTSRVRAQIVRMVPVEREGKSAYLMGCRFVERFQ